MIENIQGLGIGGILALLILREVFTFLNKRRGMDAYTKVFSQINDLWNWHNVRDQDGIPTWYVRRSLEDSVSKLADVIEKLDDHIGLLNTEMRMLREDVKNIRDD